MVKTTSDFYIPPSPLPPTTKLQLRSAIAKPTPSQQQMAATIKKQEPSNKQSHKAKVKPQVADPMLQKLPPSEKYEYSNMKTMISLLESHPMSFMFNCVDSESLTLNELKTAVKLGKFKQISDLEKVIGKMYEDVESMLSDLHWEINQVIEKHESIYVKEAAVEVYNAMQSITKEQRQECVKDCQAVKEESNGEKTLCFIPLHADSILSLQFKLLSL